MNLNFRSVPQAIKAAIALGATVQIDDDAINIDAPRGWVWGSTHTHEIVIRTSIWRKSRKAVDIVADIRSDLSYGLRKCDDDCCNA